MEYVNSVFWSIVFVIEKCAEDGTVIYHNNISIYYMKLLSIDYIIHPGAWLNYKDYILYYVILMKLFQLL